MVSASAEFFATPVLLATVASHLDIRSLVRLAKTCQELRSRCMPYIWKGVDLLNVPSTKKIKSFVKQLKDLTTRGVYVRSLKICRQFLALYSNGVNSDPFESPNGLTGCLTLSQIARFRPSSFSLSLDLLASNACSESDGWTILLPRNMAIENLCYLLSFNPSLSHLKIVAHEIDTPLKIRLLARAISNLKKLEHLELESVLGADPWRDALPTVFLSFPETLKSLVIRAGNASQDGTLHVTPEETDFDFQDGPVVLRQEPLSQLTKLTLVVYNALDLSHYGILQHMPNLVTLEFQFLQELGETNLAALAPAARAHCHALLNFIVRQPSKHGPDTEMIQLLAGLNPTLETLSYDHFQDEASLIAPVLQRYCDNLRDIRFRSCRALHGDTIRSILTFCAVLERFQVLNTDGTPGGSATIEDLVTDEWACTGIRHLELAVFWGEFEENEPYYLQTPPKQHPPPKDQERWNLLEKLYIQVGALKELEVLGLQGGIHVSIEDVEEADRYDGYEDDMREQAAFPQLFALGNPKTHKRGYLTWLGGLTKLKELRGSIHMASPEIAATLGRREVLWMTEHWPCLKVIELLEYAEKIPKRVPDYPHLNLFMKHLPAIDICRSRPPLPPSRSLKSPYEMDIFTVV